MSNSDTRPGSVRRCREGHNERAHLSGRSRFAIVSALALAAILTTGRASISAQTPLTTPGKPVVLPLAFEHSIRSRINGRIYVVQVALPLASARPGGDTLRFPSLYLLDGDWILPQVAATLRGSTLDGPSGVVLIGVGYPPGTALGVPAPEGGATAY